MSDVEIGMYYMKYNRVPPVNLYSWVHVYNIIVNAGFGKL